MDSHNGKLLAALLGGAAVGATLAVLFAPAKGSEIRNKIIEEAGGLKDVLASVINELVKMQSAAADTAARQKV